MSETESPRTIISDEIAGFTPEPDGGQDGLANLERADGILAALHNAGYEIEFVGYPAD
ncbi:hypothetical protein H7J71_02145 [Mycolicibacterium peregrinum]|uniref:hypothetical protein n=1 Tax=Mycolicibacterium peregrinum TaxID=43304 RepID=UPI000AC7F032|nr:hypothetical protein [Mycolicibacterium peregrinum]MCV7200812.1 hypothetical protein [Mycolicibacterium peregrinum]